MKINGFVPNNEIFTKMSVGQENKIETSSNNTFGNVLKGELDKVNESQIASEDITERFIKGEDIDVHNVMVAGEEAKLSLQLAVQVRNKLVEAYQEISRMQL
ncbi:flagellar hook-basal body complex protein FliE [Clostridium frigidicarnis]|uniref:Flagellar hook-basal body complex protein FliE n=1 Tax=Clostridium frigidicarnis TaxID=84698 RepID=A0A1I0VDR8_9CLOT|nr:flagellar hook-basal body complex protein FliE [Clostridium frigidicarnis]SFA74589.1 flagellar hook-basal body complex protein FliE [Clostridium frigidicarnis]